VEAVQWLARIAAEADANVKQRVTTLPEDLAEKVLARTDISVAFAACRTAGRESTPVDVAFTEGGGTAPHGEPPAGGPPCWADGDELTARRMGILRA